MTLENHECVREEQFINIEKRLTSNEEKVKTIFKQNDKLEETLKKLDCTQDRLAIEIAELNNTFTILKWLVGVLITLFSGMSVFLVTELIKLI
ncbi:hypothetical protein [Methanobrevibacter sp.]|uniref:hypothetical protein n=1 Tax=Methanobrevibacter sp. TaxID=66852 RepID=UPI0026DEF904|nr:hypothetical protein [Methanobrevibacter sp.]MDO5824664.1 hypothetical protein [Methanobrevibacter sp.]